MPSVVAPDGRYLAATGRVHEAGEVVEVDDVTYASLVEQGWEPAPEDRKAPARARSSKADPEAADKE